jgi:hypothetical protein
MVASLENAVHRHIGSVAGGTRGGLAADVGFRACAFQDVGSGDGAGAAGGQAFGCGGGTRTQHQKFHQNSNKPSLSVANVP